MKLNLPADACDPERLEWFLRGDLSEVQEREFTLHLNSCESCRCSLAEQAAEPEVWREAEMLLKSPQFDSQHAEEQTEQSTRRPLQIQNVLDALSPTDDPAMLGRLGGYEVSGVVGAGGMGVVLKASDKSLDRTVAIKVLAPHLATSGAARKRFAREAKAAAAVLHPNVIAVHSVSNDEALPYLVMPYVRGTSLQKRLNREGPLTLHEILRIGSQVAAGLAAAHAQGLVHRDIKPANILLEEGIERVTLTDFGLARAVDDATITHSGVIAGTPQYMSPEQARGEAPDPRSDLFSLGSVLYAICTGRPPFRAETSYGVMRRITDDEPKAIRALNSDVPQWLCHIVVRLMSKRAADRYASAAEVAELLEACLAHVQQPDAVPLPASLATQPAGRRFSSISRRRPGVIAMTAAFALLGPFLWQATAPPDISGRWISQEGGEVVIEGKDSANYQGTFTGLIGSAGADHDSSLKKLDSGDRAVLPTGKLELKWSRAERRFNGPWREGGDLNGKISLRLVGDEIHGALTSSKTSAKGAGVPRLADFIWKRSVDKKEVPIQPKRQRFEPVEGRPEDTSWTVFTPPSLFSQTDWVVMAHMTIGGEARIQLPEDEQPRCVIKLLKGSDDAITVQVQDAAKKSKTTVSIPRDQSAEVTVDGQGYKISYPSAGVAPTQPDTSHRAQVIVKRVEDPMETDPASAANDVNTLPKGLEFLTPYKQLRGLSLGMTEKEFLAIVDSQKLVDGEFKVHKATQDSKTAYSIPTGDGHTVLVMFAKGSDTCTGIQRLRGEAKAAEAGATP